MEKGKGSTLTVLEAMDNLSHLAELDLERRESHAIETSPEAVKETFRVLNNYLRHLYEKQKGHLQNREVQKSIRAIMVLAGEAAQKVDKYTALFKGAHGESVTQLKEYQDLQQFYLTKIAKRLEASLGAEEAWQMEWGTMEEGSLDVQRRGLRDLETIRKDRDYDLLYIRKEDGTPFFNRNLVRHIQLVGEFDQLLSTETEESPFLKTKIAHDRNLHYSARGILHAVEPYLGEFYKQALHFKDREFVSSLNKAIMALMLATNTQNLLQNAIGKNCASYYADFHLYLREALNSAEYLEMLSAPSEKLDKFTHCLLNLSHGLAAYAFLRMGSQKEASLVIERLVSKEGARLRAPHAKPISLWTSLLNEEELLSSYLKQYPSGPLLKTLEFFRKREGQRGFDPILQGNFPKQLFTFTDGKAHVSCLRIPSPTRQEVINEAKIVQEFRGFLRSLLRAGTEEKHLLINLQDRTSWHERARCIALEGLQKEAEFANQLIIITIPKSTDFYFQADAYKDMDEAALFIDQLKQQIASGEECGFYFPPSLNKKELDAFVDKVCSLIHQHFLGNKKLLSRKNRLDFIEIFYQLLALKLIDLYTPTSVSFTCKDAIDVGPCATAGFFALLRTLHDSSAWKAEEKEFLTWMLYSDALVQRERVVDSQSLHRMVSASATVEAEMQKSRAAFLKELSALYPHLTLNKLKIAS